MIRILIVLFGLLASGCEYRYRYHCQDPANWEKKECQHPRCEMDGECSDVLTNGISDEVLGKKPTNKTAEEPPHEQ